jgi:hypothetical protein
MVFMTVWHRIWQQGAQHEYRAAPKKPASALAGAKDSAIAAASDATIHPFIFLAPPLVGS